MPHWLDQPRHTLGFSLLELLVAVAIIGILASLVVPSYMEFVQKSRRAEAHTALMDNLNRLEQFFLDHKRYPTDWLELGYTAAALHQGNPARLWADPTPDHQYYTLETYTDANVAVTTQQLTRFGQPVDICTNRPCFIILATAMNSQQQDSRCTEMAITSEGARVSLPSADCW